MIEEQSKQRYALWLVFLYRELGVDFWSSIIKMAEALECLPQFDSWRQQRTSLDNN
jgi:hypothetical protein